MMRIWGAVSLLLIVVSALFAGRWGLDDARALWCFVFGAYWFVAANLIVFLYCLCRSYCADWNGVWGRRCWPFVLGVIGLVCGCVAYVSQFEEVGFKTVMDEHLIASTAQRLYADHEAVTTVRYEEVDGRHLFLENDVDKRPVFFQFLVSLVHGLFGYDGENSIWLNVWILCPLLFLLLYLLGSRLWGAWGGGLLCAWIASIPLCSFIFMGGGLELLNLVLLVALILLCQDFWKQPTAARCGALCFCATLLAQTRYESVVFVLPVGVVLFLYWRRIGQLRLHWPLYITPLFLVPYLWQNRIFSMDASNWQLEGQVQPFSLEYVPDNFLRSVNYFLNMQFSTPNSWLLAWGALIASVCLIGGAVRGWRVAAGWLQGAAVPLVACSLGFSGLYLILLCYSWDFGGAIVQRLCLPLYLPMGILLVLFLKYISLKLKFVRVASLLILLGYVIGYAAPLAAVANYDRGVGWQVYAWIHSMFEEGKLDAEGLYITENPFFYSIYGYACFRPQVANANKQGLIAYMVQEGSRAVYTCVRYRAGDDGWRNEMYNRLDASFQLEPMLEHHLSPDRKLVFYRIVGVEAVD
jgi:hypothetical protein